MKTLFLLFSGCFLPLPQVPDRELRSPAPDLSGVKVDEDFKRYYPYDTFASRVLGFTGGDNQGIIGLEVKYEEVLKGTDGTILTVTDAVMILNVDPGSYVSLIQGFRHI